MYYGKMENLNESRIDVLTNEERDELLQNLFEWEEESLDSSFLYMWKWAELYWEITKDPNYYFINSEISCLKNLRENEKFNQVLAKTNYITDVWCWDGEKAIALLWNEQSWWHGTYIPEDYSQEMLAINKENVEKHLDVMYAGSIILNKNWYLTQNNPNNMYLFLWWTICNCTDEEIINDLKNMDNNWILAGNHILLSYFTAPNTQEEVDKLIKIYNSEANKRFHENGMQMLWLSKDDFEYDTIYVPDNPSQKEWPFSWKIKWIIRAKKDNIIRLSNWKRINIAKWKEFTLHYSRRFTKEWIEKLFKKSGCDVVLAVEEQWNSIVLLKRKPAQLWKIKSISKKAIIWAIITGSVFGLYYQNKQIKELKEKEKAYKEWQEQNQNTSNNWSTFHKQEVDELISALQLDKLKDENNKNIIINLFNKYIEDHKKNQISDYELIRWFWDEYWNLIIDCGVTHPPFDFITPDLIKNTKTLWNISENQPRNIIETRKFDGPFEHHDDAWQTYLILRVNIKGKRIYLAAKNMSLRDSVYLDGKNKVRYVKNNKPYKGKGNDITISFSTNAIKEIKNKSGLDNKTISNTNNFNLLTDDIHKSWSEIVFHYPIKLTEDYITYTWTPKTVHLHWNTFYIKIWRTYTWKSIWLASNSPDWPFTTSKFIEISRLTSQRQLNHGPVN